MNSNEDNEGDDDDKDENDDDDDVDDDVDLVEDANKKNGPLFRGGQSDSFPKQTVNNQNNNLFLKSIKSKEEEHSQDEPRILKVGGFGGGGAKLGK